MQSRRDYAASLGLAIAGARGKFSNDAKAAIAKAEAEGQVFSDTVKPTAAPKATSEPAYVKQAHDEIQSYRSASEYRYPEQSYRALTDDGVEVTLKSACMGCGYSLLDHRCDQPVTVDGRISIVQR